VFRRSKKLRDSLTKTRRSFFGQISGLLGGGQITEETWEDLEALLVQADVGVSTTMVLVDRLRDVLGDELADDLIQAWAIPHP